MRLLSWVSELLFPSKCVLCGRILEKNELDLCGACRVDSPEWVEKRVRYPFIETNLALWHYEGKVRQSLLRYKFHGRRGYAKSYGRLLAMKLMEQRDGEFDLITWVPISRWRKLRRGYDQVKLISDAVGQELGMEPVPCLTKIRHNPPQSGISGQAHRRANVLGVYEPYQPDRFRGKRVLILDDIITTGATLSECARVLLTAGAKEVHCAAVAAARHHKG